MSVNTQTTRKLLWAVIPRPRLAFISQRHAHSAAHIPLRYSRARPTISGHHYLSSRFQPDTTEDLHSRKRRRYSQDTTVPLETKSTETFHDQQWEAVEGSSLLVRPTNGRRSKQGGLAAAGRPMISRSAKDVKKDMKRERRAFEKVRRDLSAHQDAGRLVSKEKRALFLPKDPEEWQVQKKGLLKKFKDGWNPRKKLSPDTVDGIRALHEQDPERYSTPTLSQHFKVSPEAIRRILKGKWRPSETEMQDRRERWARRHDKIWDQKAELGLRPRRKTDRRLERPEEFEENLRAKELLDAARSA